MLAIPLILGASALCILPPDTDLKKDGAFGFPQKDATVLCDTPDLRVSAASDAEHLYVQAIVWKDNDAALGETDDGREIGDNSTLVLDVDGDGKATAEVDRSYSLSPWPQLAGLHYSVTMGPTSSSGLQGDSKGRGSIQYVDSGATKVRVDNYLIPLAEINRKAGEGKPILMAYYGSSTAPALVVNSVGFEREGKKYYAHHLPREKYHPVDLKRRPAFINVQQVPEGRGTIKIVSKKAAQKPKVGDAPPAVVAESWLNWAGKEPPTLESLKGKVVVVEFWATWCGPCVEGIPHLNELHEKHAKEGLVLLSMTDQSRPHVEKFVQERGMKYPIGVKSDAVDAYGVSGIPHAFVIGRDGKLLWHGHPAQKDFDAKIVEALGAQ